MIQEPTTCDDCGETVSLARSEHDTLRLVCACNRRISIRVPTVLPDGWQA